MINTKGDLRASLISAATAVAFYGVGQCFGDPKTLTFGDHVAKSAAHGLVGGVSSEVQGGEFSTGFLSAGATQAMAPAIDELPTEEARITAAAVVGGFAEELGGGELGEQGAALLVSLVIRRALIKRG